MKPRTIAGISGAVVLGGLGYVAISGTGWASYRVRKSTFDEYEGIEQIFPDGGEAYIDANPETLSNLEDDPFGYELLEEDVFNWQSDEETLRAGKRKKKKPAGGGAKGVSEDMHNTMLKLHERHWGLVDLTLKALGVRYGKGEADQFGEMTDDFAGWARNAPIIDQFTDEFQCRDDGKNIWEGGAGPLDAWVLIPQEPVLFSNRGGSEDARGNKVFNEHLEDYQYYWRWFEKWIASARGADFGASSPKLQVASYGAKDNVQFKLRAKLKAQGVWSIINQQSKWFQTPKIPINKDKRLYISQPDMPGIAAKLNTQRMVDSTPSAGYTSVVIWFLQNAPDMTPFQIPEKLEELRLLHSRAAVIPIGVGGDKEMFRNLMAYIRPELQGVYSKDADYSQYFHVNTPQDLMSDEFMSNLNKYICLIQHRATCRLLRAAAYTATEDEPTQAGPTEGFGDYVDGGFREIGDLDIPTDSSFTISATISPPTKGPTQDVQIDSCCGHDQFTASPYDQNLRRCCSDGKTVSLDSRCR